MMLVINPEKVRRIIEQVRAFDAEDDIEDPALEAAEEDEAEEEDGDEEALDGEAAREAFVELVSTLDEKELADLVALTWVGRGTYEPEHWPDAVQEATQVGGVAKYLLTFPELDDHLEDGLAAVEEADDDTD